MSTGSVVHHQIMLQDKVDVFREIFAINAHLALVVAAGVATHVILKNIEPKISYSLHVASALALVPSVLTVVARPSFSRLLHAYTFSSVVYYGALLCSIALYRLSPAHSLWGYPGPLFGKLTKFWDTYLAWTGKRFLYIHEMHKKYGDLVRTGPNEISINNVSAIQQILGSKGLPKGDFYIQRMARPDLPTAIIYLNGQKHEQRRRIWSRAFTSTSLQEYGDMVIKRAQQLYQRILASSDSHSSIDLADAFSLCVFDIMGDFCYGGAFEMMRDGDQSQFRQTMLKGLRVTYIYSHIPWAGRFLLPRSNNVKRMITNFHPIIARRKSRGSYARDLFHYLMGENGIEALKPFEILVDSTVAIVGGSDTTTYIISCVFYYLMIHREVAHRLRAELDESFPNGELPFDTTRLAHLPFLNAVLHEALRLCPPICTGSPRVVPKGHGPALVMERCFPEGTQLVIPIYTIQRDPRYFSPAPCAFWPDRWLPEALRRNPPTSDPYIHNTSAFMPFSYGPSNCVGKNMAWLEMRVITALLVQRFEFDFVEGYDPRRWAEGICEYVTCEKGPLPTRMRARRF